MTESYDLVPPNLAIKAMRDNGYRNTAYAVAELIDNSIQANASTCEVLVEEAEERVSSQIRRRVRKMAVLDNGDGMSPALLRQALQFGNGSHLQDRSGIGRFGMGLPSASISQCRRVEVWTWTDGPANASYAYIDLDEVEKGTLQVVPEPVRREVPAQWSSASVGVGASGTLVVWSSLDRCMWRTAKTIFRHSEFVIARMYRRFLHSGQAQIRFAAFTEGRPTEAHIDEYAVANDPGYLISPSSTPKPFDNEPMFQKDGDKWQVTHRIAFEGEEHDVTISFSLATEAARKISGGRNPGSLPHGKHAAKNVGVSLVRAGRELDMDQSLVNSYNPTERWWGVEVDFPPSLDELFGVTNNKQDARHFTEIAKHLDAFNTPKGGALDYLDEVIEDDDPTGPLLDMIRLIDRRIAGFRDLLALQTKGSRAKKQRFDESSAESRATRVTRDRQKDGLIGDSDEDESLPEADRRERLEQDLIDSGMNRDDARVLAAQTISTGLKYTFAEAALEGSTFFTVKPVAGDIVIKINMKHPAYENLVEVLDTESDAEKSLDQVSARLSRASSGLRLLLMAWARMEDEETSLSAKERMQDIRTEWGKIARDFMRDD